MPRNGAICYHGRSHLSLVQVARAYVASDSPRLMRCYLCEVHVVYVIASLRNPPSQSLLNKNVEALEGGASQVTPKDTRGVSYGAAHTKLGQPHFDQGTAVVTYYRYHFITCHAGAWGQIDNMWSSPDSSTARVKGEKYLNKDAFGPSTPAADILLHKSRDTSGFLPQRVLPL